MSTDSINIMVIEDNITYNQVIASSLNKQQNFTCNAQASSSDEAFQLLKEAKSQPDIILLDLELPGAHGLDVITPLLEESPQSKIIILTQSDRESDVLLAISKGASGYLLKTATRKEIIYSVNEIHKGGASIDPKLANIALKLIRRIQPEIPEEDDEMLTSRELEVLQLLSEGLIKKEIAEKLKLSPHAIDKRMRRIYDKLQVHNVAAAVATALRKGWI